MSCFSYITICRLKLGHERYPSHILRMNLIQNPDLSCGNGITNLNHLFSTLPTDNTERKSLYTRPVEVGVPFSTSITTLLAPNFFSYILGLTVCVKQVRPGLDLDHSVIIICISTILSMVNCGCRKYTLYRDPLEVKLVPSVVLLRYNLSIKIVQLRVVSSDPERSP